MTRPTEELGAHIPAAHLLDRCPHCKGADDQPTEGEQMTNDKRYHIIAVNERTGRRVQMTAYPDTHAACCVILSKITPYAWVRLMLVEAAQ